MSKVLTCEHLSKTYGKEKTALDNIDRAPDARLAGGAWPRLLEAELDGKWCELDGMIGAGVGGTSAFYAATLERPERHDLETTATHPHPTGGWPVGYAAFAPWFARAETIMREHARKTRDNKQQLLAS